MEAVSPEEVTSQIFVDIAADYKARFPND
jgi:hypothetical protein